MFSTGYITGISKIFNLTPTRSQKQTCSVACSLNLLKTCVGLSVYITLIHHVHYFQASKCEHSTHFAFQGISLLSSWPLSFSGAATRPRWNQVQNITSAMAIKVFHSNTCPFSVTIHKYTYLGPSHLRLTPSLHTKASFDTVSFPHWTSKSAGLLKDIWKNVFTIMINITVHIWV